MWGAGPPTWASTVFTSGTTDKHHALYSLYVLLTNKFQSRIDTNLKTLFEIMNVFVPSVMRCVRK